MVSTLQPPPPAPPAMPPRPRRSFAGPVVLIVLGVCFLLSNLGVISWHNFGLWFSHYWPVLLILWGIIKLVEYQQASRSGVRASGIGAGGVMLVVLVVVAGLITTEAYRLNWGQLCNDMSVEGVPWCGHTYSYTDDLQQAFPATNGNLHVTGEHGAINLTASTDNQIHVSVHKNIKADRQQQADDWNKATRPQITVNGQVVNLDANTRGAGDHWVSSDLDIAIPRKASVVLSTRHGDVSIMGRDGNADISSKHGDVSVTDLNGSLTLNLDSSSARVSQISSDVVVQGRAKDVSLEDIKGTVRLDGDFMESVKLFRVAKAVSFKTTRTIMDFTRLDGDLNLDSGDLEATNIVGPVNLRTRSKDIRLNGVSSSVQLKNQNGAVEIEVIKLGNLQVENSRGDIRIFLPENSSFQVDAQTRDGEIQSDFSALKIENGDNRSTANGTVNGGGFRVVLNNDHGTIEIRKGVAPPVPPSSSTPKPPKMPKLPEVPQPSEN
jgi:DUF4097 and DUF4098 domain-containing protein YvlB